VPHVVPSLQYHPQHRWRLFSDDDAELVKFIKEDFLQCRIYIAPPLSLNVKVFSFEKLLSVTKRQRWTERSSCNNHVLISGTERFLALVVKLLTPKKVCSRISTRLRQN